MQIQWKQKEIIDTLRCVNEHLKVIININDKERRRGEGESLKRHKTRYCQ